MQPPNQMQPPQQMQHIQQGGMPQFQPQGSAPQPVAPPNTMSSQFNPNMQMSAPAGVAPVPPPNTMNMTAPVPPPAWSTASVSHINSNSTQSLSVGRYYVYTNFFTVQSYVHASPTKLLIKLKRYCKEFNQIATLII